MTTFADFKVILTGVLNRLNDYQQAMLAIKDSLTDRYPSWDPEEDARLTVFNRLRNVADEAYLSLYLVREHLADPAWWHRHFEGRFSVVDHSQKTQNYLLLARSSYSLSSFHSVEVAIRLIVRNLDPLVCNRSTDAVKNVYSWLLARTNLGGEAGLLDLLREIRNSAHNDGRYFNRHGADVTVEHGGKTWLFQYGKPVSFATWDVLLDQYTDAAKLLSQIVDHPVVSASSAILEGS